MCILSFREVTQSLLQLEIQTGTLQPVTFEGQCSLTASKTQDYEIVTFVLITKFQNLFT